MMICLYQGTPGSGKSFHAVSRIYDMLRYNHINVIANFPVSVQRVFLTRRGRVKDFFRRWFPKLKPASGDYKPVRCHFDYWDNSAFSPEGLSRYCNDHHRYILTPDGERIYPEGQTLIVIDEAQILFNCRDWGNSRRQDWCKFFSQHRHYGFDIILIAQHERMLDRQIRYLIETYVDHRNLRNFNWFARLVSFFAGGSVFISLYRWQGCKDVYKRGATRYNSRVASIYNSYRTFDVDSDTDAGQGPPAAGPLSRTVRKGG